jgi:class 3 adenylate cyclase/tetratricopeptide (TPR) repeat protein
MRCSACTHDNPAEAQFCGACGARLELVCHACQAANPPANRFCHRCGAPLQRGGGEAFEAPSAYTPKHLADKILRSASALAGERKQVTILFVDVSGFTSLSEQLDPEDVHRLMTRAFELMLAEVHRYEGTVNQFLGDGIMALFGAPIAHEDHARRAVHAALGIRSTLAEYQRELAARGIAFRVRQGLNTGLVVVGSIGTDLRMDYTAVGDTTNVAARLQQAAEPGAVTVSDGTHRLIRGYFETRALGHVHLKGKLDAVAAWDIVGPGKTRTRLEVEEERGLTPLVGREAELQTLLEAFERARRGAGQVVFVVGEAGIGKSRLLLELHRRVGETAAWHEAHALSFGRAMTLHPLVELARGWFAIEDGDAEPMIVDKIERGLAALGDDLAGLAPYLRALLSVDPGNDDVRAMTPAQRRGETLDAMRRLLARAAERQPQVIAIEDLHWIDGASEHFMAGLLETVPSIAALVVLTYRPGYANPFGERSYFTRLVPAALSVEDSGRMAAAVLAIDELPEELRRLVSARAEGNPFYVEELVKSLQESGALRRVGGRLELARPAHDIAVPETIQDVIAARIDRLAEAPKHTLQLAAVVGREFTRRIIDRLAEVPERTDEILRPLTELELIYERRLFPELIYMFKHALTQDVAYGSLLLQRRRELHALIGRAIEELYAERLAEHYEILAHHFSRAEDWPRAAEYLIRAARKAADSFALRQAVELYGEALEATRHDVDALPPPRMLELLQARAELYFGVGDFQRSRDAGEQAVALARRLGDRLAEANALVQIASSLQWAEDFPNALGRAREAIEVAEAIKADAPLSGGLFVQGYMHAVTGRLDEAESQLKRAFQIARTAGDAGRQAMALNLLGHRHSWRGEYERALELNTEGIGIARAHRLAVPLLRCLWVYGLASAELGAYDRALEALNEGLALAEKMGDDAFIPRFVNTLGWLHIDVGDFATGVELSERAYVETQRSSRAGHGTGLERRAFIRNNEADAFMARGELAAAAEALEETHWTVTHPPPSRWMTWRYGTHCYAGQAQLAVLRGDADRARRFADQSLELSTPTGARKYQSWAWRIKGESARLRGAWDEAEQALHQAVALAEGVAQPRLAWMAIDALARLDAARGRHESAAKRYAEAWTLVQRLRERTHHAALRAGLETHPLVRELAERVPR